MPRLVLISDTHQRHKGIVLPEGDILVHSGDITMMGDLTELHGAAHWMAEQPFEYIIAIAGNHDWCFQNDNRYEARKIMVGEGLTYLEDSSVEYKGLKFWGSPDTREFNNWAFNRNSDELKKKWNTIPDDTNVVVTHGPPFGIGDRVRAGDYVGCKHLLKTLRDRLKDVKLHTCGHIHEGYGQRRGVGASGQTVTLVNASICNLQYKPDNAPIVVDL
jgi:Icc-related predicted phosphoesterase